MKKRPKARELDDHILIRVSKAQKKAIKAKAGKQPVGAYIREKALN